MSYLSQDILPKFPTIFSLLIFLRYSNKHLERRRRNKDTKTRPLPQNKRATVTIIPRASHPELFPLLEMCYKIFNVCTKCSHEHFIRFNSCGNLRKETPESKHKPKKILYFFTGPCPKCQSEEPLPEPSRDEPDGLIALQRGDF